MSEDVLRNRLHQLVDKFADEELECAWEKLLGLYCDRMMLGAILAAKSSQQPWDILTHEEAVRILA